MRNPRSSPPSEAVQQRLVALQAEWQEARGAGGDAPAPATHTRIRPRASAPWEAADAVPVGPGATDVPEPVEVPLPGRHARRRWARTLADAAPGSLRGRVALAPGHLLLVGSAVVVALVFVAWWVWRASPAVVAPPAPGRVDPIVAVSPSVASPPAASTAGAVPGGVAASADLVVDVAGKVRRPGIAELPAGSRVVDALRAAGGARPGTDLASLNLARPLVDGEQILVGVAPVPGAAAAAVSGPSAAAPSALVSLNTADQTTLETLPGVGPVTAQAIIGWREANGGFGSVDQLVEVDGIGEATLARLAPLVTL